MSPAEAAWLAGVFDGEGNLTLVKGNSWRMSISNTNYELLERIVEVAGCGNLIPSKRYQPHHAPCWAWTCYGNRLRSLLRQMMPWLIVKREKAEAAVERK